MKQNNFKILTLPIRLALVILIFGALFKVMHWPYAKEFMFLGGILIGVLYTIRFFNKKEKQQLDYVKVSFTLLCVFSYLIQVFHLPYILEVCLIILFFWWFIQEGPAYFKNRKFKKKGFIKVGYYALMPLASFSLFFGVLFKIQHLPYGSVLFMLGIVLLNITLLLDYFIRERKS